MNFKERLKFFTIGTLAGILFITLLFGNRTSCKDGITHYMPQGRVIEEIQFKNIKYSEEAKDELSTLKIGARRFKDFYLKEADVDFELSDQRAKPCSKYVLFSQDSIQKLTIQLDICRLDVLVQSIHSQPLDD